MLRNSEKIVANFQEESSDRLSSNLLSAITDAAESSSMTFKPRRAQKMSKDWFDTDFKMSQLKVKHLFRMCKAAAFSKAKMIKYRDAKYEYRKMIKSKKRQICTRKNSRGKLANIRDSLEFWNTIRSYRPAYANKNPTPLNSWEHFYSSILSPDIPDPTMFYRVGFY